MATGLSKAHQAQSSSNKVRRQQRRADQVTERNKVRGIVRDLRRRGHVIRWDHATAIVDGAPIEAAAINRIALKTGITRCKAFIEAAQVPA
jgi:hypothetical protein